MGETRRVAFACEFDVTDLQVSLVGATTESYVLADGGEIEARVHGFEGGTRVLMCVFGGSSVIIFTSLPFGLFVIAVKT